MNSGHLTLEIAHLHTKFLKLRIDAPPFGLRAPAQLVELNSTAGILLPNLQMTRGGKQHVNVLCQPWHFKPTNPKKNSVLRKLFLTLFVVKALAAWDDQSTIALLSKLDSLS